VPFSNHVVEVYLESLFFAGPPGKVARKKGLSGGAIAAIVIVIILLVLIAVDIFCCFFNQCGVAHMCAAACAGKKREKCKLSLFVFAKILVLDFGWVCTTMLIGLSHAMQKRIGRSLNFPCFSFWRFPEIYSTLKILLNIFLFISY
jgi:hypothetical protein